MSQASPIKRRKSRQIMVGTVPVGGDAPISVQSMTNTARTGSVPLIIPTRGRYITLGELNLG